jgi:guanosine-diphosphatase
MIPQPQILPAEKVVSPREGSDVTSESRTLPIRSSTSRFKTFWASVCVAILGGLIYALLSPQSAGAFRLLSPSAISLAQLVASSTIFPKNVSPSPLVKVHARSAGTVHCTSPHPSALRLVQYALMIDVSTIGSRIHIYKFHNCKASPTLENETVKRTRPSLATLQSWKTNPAAAAKSLDVLLDQALRVIPPDLHNCTPVLVKASRGLLVTGTQQSQTILSAVYKRLSTRYPFPIHSGSDEGPIMDSAAAEGIYTWLTVNYLLGAVGGSTPTPSTHAILDMRSTSILLVFEPSFTKDQSMADGDHKRILSFAGTNYTLYQYSHHGYGPILLSFKVHQRVSEMSSFLRESSENSGTHPDDVVVIPNPCLSRDTQKEVHVVDRYVPMSGSDVGSFEACSRIVEQVMEKDAPCDVEPCSFNGVYQPSVQETFPTGKVFLLPEFYGLLALLYNDSSELTVDTIAKDAQTVCAGEKAWKERWEMASTSLMQGLRKNPEWCFELTYIHALMTFGYGFAADREVAIVKQINGTELGWSWGAILAMVAGS